MDTSTIAAIATPGGKGGIGIIKISGKKALSIAASLFHKSGNDRRCKSLHGENFESHRIYHGHIIGPDSGQIVDEVLVSAMKAPRSYTREDVVEINAHGGLLTQHKILELVISNGARLAEPGEFTRRAFLNGRIDLTQAEGVIDIINARTEKALEIAGEQVKGRLAAEIGDIRTTLLGILSEIEASIDFPDETGNMISRDILRQRLKANVSDPLTDLVRQYHDAHLYRDGIQVAVVGRPNVGKSSLVNRLLQRERVIVTPIPGTTRDAIEASLDINGIPVTITDTAGLHASEDPVEVIGIEKTRECIEAADVVFFLVDAASPLLDEDEDIYHMIQEKNTVLVVNKKDLLVGEKKYEIPASWKIPAVMTSALYDQGIDALKAQFKDSVIRNGEPSNFNRMVPNLRHKMSLERGVAAVESAMKAIDADISEELIAIDLTQGLEALGEITGQTLNEAVLDEIFSRFCIGK